LSYLYSDESPQIITTTDWGTGTKTKTNICNACGLDKNSTVPYNVAITNAGKIFFSGRKFFEEFDPHTKTNISVRYTGVYTSMDNGSNCSFVPIALDEIENNYLGHDNIEDIYSLNVPKDGNVLVFSAYDNSRYLLCAVDPSGQNLRIITTSNEPIHSIRMSSTGDKILFTKGFQWSDKETLWTISLNGDNMIQLTTPPPNKDIEIATKSANISPDGSWIAYPFSDYGDNPLYGIAFIQSDGSNYHWVNTGDKDVSPVTSINSISFLANSKSIIFSGNIYTENNDSLDLFILDIDQNSPNLSNITNTPERDELYPVVLLQ